MAEPTAVTLIVYVVTNRLTGEFEGVYATRAAAEQKAGESTLLEVTEEPLR